MKTWDEMNGKEKSEVIYRAAKCAYLNSVFNSIIYEEPVEENYLSVEIEKTIQIYRIPENAIEMIRHIAEQYIKEMGRSRNGVIKTYNSQA